MRRLATSENARISLLSIQNRWLYEGWYPTLTCGGIGTTNKNGTQSVYSQVFFLLRIRLKQEQRRLGVVPSLRRNNQAL